MKFVGAYEDLAVYQDEEGAYKAFQFVPDKEEIANELVYEIMTIEEVTEECRLRLGIDDYRPEELKRYYERLPNSRFLKAMNLNFAVRVGRTVYFAKLIYDPVPAKDIEFLPPEMEHDVITDER